MKYLSLFSGIGGFELGIQQAYENTKIRLIQQEISRSEHSGNIESGWRHTEPDCVGYSEIDKYAIATYQSHFPEHHNYGDITKINEQELPDFDMLVGGFPCQAFSIAGKRKGFEDTRGTLFFDIARIIKAKQPRLVFLENVKGLLSHDNGETFRTIIATLDELGYDIQWQVLNSKNHGVPQNRERVFIIGHLRGTSRPEVFPFGIGTGETNEGVKRKRITTARTRNFGSSAQLHAVDEICSTLTTSMGTGGNNVPNIIGSKIRRLTPTECERLQGFPDVEKSVMIQVCKENLNNLAYVEDQNHKWQKLVGSVEKNYLQENVLSATESLLINNQLTNKPAQPDVLINCEENGVEIHSQGRLLLSANGVAKKNWCPQFMELEDFVQIVAGINTTLEQITNRGEVESHLIEECLILQQNGKKLVRLCGKEMMQLAESVKNDSTTLKKLLKSTTSDLSDIKNLEQRLITLFSFVILAIIGFTPKEIQNQNICTIEIKSKLGWTFGMSDTQRYKQCGNAVTVNVIKDIAERLL